MTLLDLCQRRQKALVIATRLLLAKIEKLEQAHAAELDRRDQREHRLRQRIDQLQDRLDAAAGNDILADELADAEAKARKKWGRDQQARHTEIETDRLITARCRRSAA